MQAMKPVPSIKAFSELCNRIQFASFKSDPRDVSFTRLDSTKVKVVGLFGYNEDIWKILHSKGMLSCCQQAVFCVLCVGFYESTVGLGSALIKRPVRCTLVPFVSSWFCRIYLILLSDKCSDADTWAPAH